MRDIIWNSFGSMDATRLFSDWWEAGAHPIHNSSFCSSLLYRLGMTPNRAQRKGNNLRTEDLEYFVYTY